MIAVQSEGRRHYLTGDTYSVKDRLRGAGCKWDPERRAWWTGKQETAEQLVAQLQSGAQATPPDDDQPQPQKQYVAGKATYKGRTYYIAGRVNRGRTHYDDQVDAVTSRDGSKMLLLFRDGSSQFWADRCSVEVLKSYDRPQTIVGLQRYAEQIRANGGAHPNACPNCGSTSCSTAYGRPGLCDED